MQWYTHKILFNSILQCLWNSSMKMLWMKSLFSGPQKTFKVCLMCMCLYYKYEVTCYCFFLMHCRSQGKILTCWLAGLPQQLVLLGLRNPELSEQLIGIIYSAASRANREILQSLQAAAPLIYGNYFHIWELDSGYIKLHQEKYFEN